MQTESAASPQQAASLWTLIAKLICLMQIRSFVSRGQSACDFFLGSGLKLDVLLHCDPGGRVPSRPSNIVTTTRRSGTFKDLCRREQAARIGTRQDVAKQESCFAEQSKYKKRNK